MVFSIPLYERMVKLIFGRRFTGMQLHTNNIIQEAQMQIDFKCKFVARKKNEAGNGIRNGMMTPWHDDIHIESLKGATKCQNDSETKEKNQQTKIANCKSWIISEFPFFLTK